MELFIVPLLKDYIEARLDTLLQGLRGGDVLDVGCGRQPFRGLIERYGCNYISLDAQQNADRSVDYIASIDDTLPPALLDRSPFAMLLCTEVLEHVADWNTAFANMYRLVTPGSKILLTCPFFYPLHEEPYDFWRPTTHALIHFAKRHGMCVDEISRLGDGWDVLGTLVGASPIKWSHKTLSMRGLQKLMRLGRHYLLRHLASNGWLRRIPLSSKLYLSNALLLTCS